MERLKKLIIQLFKFGIVGGFCTLLDFLIYTVLIYIDGSNPAFANILSFVITLPLNFILSMRFVFKAKENLSITKQVIIFFACSIFGFIINETIVYYGGILFDYSLYKYLPIIVKVFATAVSTIINFITKKTFLDRKEKRTD